MVVVYPLRTVLFAQATHPSVGRDVCAAARWV
jgi:hypothetical protein